MRGGEIFNFEAGLVDELQAWKVWNCRQVLGASQLVRDLSAGSLGKMTLQPAWVYESQQMKAWSEAVGEFRSLGMLILERRISSLEEGHRARSVVVMPSWLLDGVWVVKWGLLVGLYAPHCLAGQKLRPEKWEERGRDPACRLPTALCCVLFCMKTCIIILYPQKSAYMCLKEDLTENSKGKDAGRLRTDTRTFSSSVRAELQRTEGFLERRTLLKER